MLNSDPVPPVNTRNSGPVVVDADTVPVTFAQVVVPPVDATVAVPTTGPVAEPVRSVMVPPGPADATRAVNDVTPPRLYGVNEIQSPLSIELTALPPVAP